MRCWRHCGVWFACSFFPLPPIDRKNKIQIIYRKRARREKRKNNKNSIWDKRAREETRDFHNYGQLLFLNFCVCPQLFHPEASSVVNGNSRNSRSNILVQLKVSYISSDSIGRVVLLLFVWCHRIDERLDSILYSNRRLQPLQLDTLRAAVQKLQQSTKTANEQNRSKFMYALMRHWEFISLDNGQLTQEEAATFWYAK